MSQQLELLTESPSQWGPVSFVTPEIQKKEIKPFVLLALKELEGNPDSRTSSLQNINKFAAVRAVVRHVARLRSATKEPWNLTDVQSFLEGLKFSSDCAMELSTLLCTDKIYESIPKHLRIKPGLVDLQWKIDVSLCQSTSEEDTTDSATNKEMIFRKTQVILIFSLTDGQINTYRLSLSKFLEFRFIIASALKV